MYNRRGLKINKDPVIIFNLESKNVRCNNNNYYCSVNILHTSYKFVFGEQCYATIEHLYMYAAHGRYNIWKQDNI